MAGSGSLDAFTAALAAADVDRAEAVARENEALRRDLSERDMALRALNEAISVWRTAIAAPAASEISTGDDAFREWEFASAVAVDRPTERIQERLCESLLKASECLGPLAGGRAGQFTHPDRPPPVAEDVVPTAEELVEVARLAGAAVGEASKRGLVDGPGVVRNLLAGS